MSRATPPFQSTTAPLATGLSEVRYSYRDMMRELKAERSAAVFSMEKLDQSEIGKIFKARKVRRDKDKR